MVPSIERGGPLRTWRRSAGLSGNGGGFMLCQSFMLSFASLRGGRRLVHCSRLRGSMLRVFDFKPLMFLVISVTVYFKSLMCLVKSKS